MPVHQNKPSKACGYICHALSPELAELDLVRPGLQQPAVVVH